MTGVLEQELFKLSLYLGDIFSKINSLKTFFFSLTSLIII